MALNQPRPHCIGPGAGCRSRHRGCASSQTLPASYCAPTLAQVAVHAIGDLAVDEVSGVFRRALVARESCAAAAEGTFQLPDPAKLTHRPFRLEHAQHLSSSSSSSLSAGATATALAHEDITVVTNPLHLLSDGPSAAAKLGPERAGHAFALRTLTEAGVTLAFASDWPVVGLEPLLGLHAAVARQPLLEPLQTPKEQQQQGTTVEVEGTEGSGRGGRSVDGPEGEAAFVWPWLPEEAVDMEVALAAQTRGAAAALMLQDYVGMLRCGGEVWGDILTFQTRTVFAVFPSSLPPFFMLRVPSHLSVTLSPALQRGHARRLRGARPLPPRGCPPLAVVGGPQAACHLLGWSVRAWLQGRQRPALAGPLTGWDQLQKPRLPATGRCLLLDPP